MKVAIPLFRKRISPNFLTAPELLVILAQGQEINSTHQSRLSTLSLSEKRKKLLSLGIDLLICGGIDWPTKCWLEGHGIRVVDNTLGEVEKILSHLPTIQEKVTKGEKAKRWRELRPREEKEGGSHGKNPFGR